MLIVGIINHVYAEELKGEDISQTEQVKIDSKDNVDLEKENEMARV